MKIAQLIFGAAMAMLPCICSAENDKKPLTPKEYAEIHNVVSSAKNPKWLESIELLAVCGDAFTLEHLKTVDMRMPGTEMKDECQVGELENTKKLIGDKLKMEDAKAFTQLVETRLERAAWVDLHCDKLEMTLTPWTLKYLREHLETPGVKAELTRIQSDYAPKNENNEVDVITRDRVRNYVTHILEK